MRVLIAAAVFVLTGGPAWAQTPPDGLAAYQVVFLKRGAPEAPETRRQHLAYVKRLLDDGLLVAAGPIVPEGELRGVLVLSTPGLDRARELVAADPQVRSGQLSAEVLPWWGPVNIGEGYAAAVKARPPVEPRLVTYYLALLRAGPHRSQPEAEAERIQAAHLAHLNALTQAGKRVAGGPFLHDGVLRGMSVYAVSLDEARRLANADPAVKAGRLVVDFYSWTVAEGVFAAKPARR